MRYLWPLSLATVLLSLSHFSLASEQKPQPQDYLRIANETGLVPQIEQPGSIKSSGE